MDYPIGMLCDKFMKCTHLLYEFTEYKISISLKRSTNNCTFYHNEHYYYHYIKYIQASTDKHFGHFKEYNPVKS